MSRLCTSGSECQSYPQVDKRLKMSKLCTSGSKCQNYAQVVQNFKIIHK